MGSCKAMHHYSNGCARIKMFWTIVPRGMFQQYTRACPGSGLGTYCGKNVCVSFPYLRGLSVLVRDRLALTKPAIIFFRDCVQVPSEGKGAKGGGGGHAGVTRRRKCASENHLVWTGGPGKAGCRGVEDDTTEEFPRRAGDVREATTLEAGLSSVTFASSCT